MPQDAGSSKLSGISILAGLLFFLGAIVYYVSQALPGATQTPATQSTVEVAAVVGLILIAIGMIGWQLGRSGTQSVPA